MVFWSLAVQSIKFVSWLNFSEMGGSIFPDCWFSQAVISSMSATSLTVRYVDNFFSIKRLLCHLGG